jgi:hypothetical protein
MERRPNYPLISVSALVQGESLPLMQKVLFPDDSLPPPSEESKLRAFREMVAAFEKSRKR